MPATTFKGDMVVRVQFPDHGISFEGSFKIIIHPDGTQVAISKIEWEKMSPPLLVNLSTHGQPTLEGWLFCGQPVVLKPYSGKKH
jgi:hypothetical protein